MMPGRQPFGIFARAHAIEFGDHRRDIHLRLGIQATQFLTVIETIGHRQ